MPYTGPLPWLIPTLSGGRRQPPDTGDPGAYRPPPRPEWGWYILAAAVALAVLYAAVHTRAFP